MTLVLDASVVVAALVDNGSAGRWAEEQLAQGQLIAPEIMRTEVANVLRRAELAGQVDSATAALAFADLRQLKLRTVPFDSVADRIWQLRTNLTSYDAAYVAWAEALDAPLATLDTKLAKSPGPTCTFLTP
jgi:predicted nucleic acid-binding protein